MERLDPWVVGLSLAITVAIAYAACAALFFVFPELAFSFLQSLFHGVEFRRAASPEVVFRLADFGVAILALSLYAFFIGALFAAIRNMLAR